MSWKPAIAGGIVVAALGVVAGLLLNGGGGDQTTTETVMQTEPADQATTDGLENETTAADETTAALGTAKDTVAGVPMRVEITELARQGEFVTLEFTLTNLSSEDSDSLLFDFDDTGAGTAADGLLLIDPENGREHRVVRNPGQGCLCSDDIPLTLGGREEVSLFATFEAPPPDTSSVNITFPGSLGTITDVPLSG
ncbi:MAG: hypothetical protein ACRDM7_10385 [Thermoleophilaceae bacterium]